MPEYDTAQICRRGHLVTGYSLQHPYERRRFCEQDGSEVISACPTCNQKIRGTLISGELLGLPMLQRNVPSFCPDCGKPFPWTEERFRAAEDLIRELDELSDDEKARLTKSVSELAQDSPQTPVAVARVKKIAAKVGKEGLGLLQKIITDVASDAAKKMLGLP